MRKALLTVLTVLLVGAITSPALAQSVMCYGTESTGTGANSCDGTPRQYAYPVTAGAVDVTSVYIGTDDCNPANYTNICMPTDDCNPANYTNICMPTDWEFNIVKGVHPLHDTIKTPHGVATNPAPPGNCPCAIAFTLGTGAPIAPFATFTFGFDNPFDSHDVGWDVGGTIETWGAPSGLGVGPVHGPFGKGEQQQRIARWIALGKGLWIHYYFYRNSFQSWDALGGGGPVKVDDEAQTHRFKVPFAPSKLLIVYQWQQGGGWRWHYNRARPKPAAFWWRKWKVDEIDPIVICQTGEKPGDESLCLNPSDPANFDCDDFDNECSTEYFPSDAEISAAVSGQSDTIETIPAVSEWGMVVLLLLVLAACTVVIRRTRAATA